MKNKKILRIVKKYIKEAEQVVEDKTVDTKYALGGLAILRVLLVRFEREIEKESMTERQKDFDKYCEKFLGY